MVRGGNYGARDSGLKLQSWAGPGHSPVPPGGAGLLLCADEGENNPGLKLIVSGSLYRRRLLEAEATPEQ